MSASHPAPPGKPLRIAVALESSGPGGAENMVVQLASELLRRGHAPVVVSLRPGWMTERAEAAGLPVWIVPQRRGLDPLWIPRFAARLRREHIDLLHSHEFAMNIYGGAAAWLARVPSVATLHGRSYATEAPRRARAYRWLRALGMPIVAVSHDLAGFLAPRLALPPDALDVVYNGIALPALRSPAEREALRKSTRAEIGAPGEAPLALAVGNLYPVKDHATLLRAALLRPGLHVAIAGRGAEEENLRALATELGIAARVHLLGLRDDVPRWLAGADVFVQPSRSEGLPLAVLEAMAAALPVVATRVGGMHEAVVDGETGALVPPGEPMELARALAVVLDDPALGASRGAAGHARVRRLFSAPAMAAGYERVYAKRLAH